MVDDTEKLKTFRTIVAHALMRIDELLSFDSKMTLVIRDPTNVDNDIILGDDELADAMAVLKRHENEPPVIGDLPKGKMH